MGAMQANLTIRSSVFRWVWLIAGIAAWCVHAATPAVNDLIAQFQAESVFWRQDEIGDEIASVATLRDLSPLEGWLAHEDRHVRANVAYLFAKLGDRRGFDTLVGILDDYSDQRPIHYRPMSVITDDDEPTEDSLDAITRSPYALASQIQEDRYYAVHLLGKLRDPRAVDVLIPLLDRDAVNHKVAWALGEIGDREAVPALVAALSNEDPLVRVTSIGALRELRAIRALPYLVGLFNDPAVPNAGDRVSVGTTARIAAAVLGLTAIVVAAIPALLLVLNTWATRIVARDRALSAPQKFLLIAGVWLIPVVGAAATIDGRRQRPLSGTC